LAPYIYQIYKDAVRGLLYGRPVIMSDTGGMAEQGADRQGVTLVGDDSELVEALRKLVADLALR